MRIIDINCRIGAIPVLGNQFTAENLLGSMQKNEVKAAVISSTISDTVDFMAGNRLVYQTVEKYAGKANLFGAVTVNTAFPDESVEEMRKYLFNERMVAVRVVADNRKSPLLHSTCRAIINSQRRYAAPVLIHAKNAADVEVIELLAAEFKTMRFIILGMGEDDWKHAVLAAETNTNISLELSGRISSDKIDYTLKTLGSHRLFYGSSLPYVDGALFKAFVENANIDDGEKADIFFNNGKRLLDNKL
ncbi:MAG: amidohydrolase family protein [Abditibacteriota bacterium]|nr:amidohydrolase family protein [Abditibacteriota bacterium]